MKRKEWGEMIGKIFGKLTVIGEAPPYEWKNKSGGRNTVRRIWSCKCVCGSTQTFWGTRLRSGSSTQCSSCGYKTRPQSTKRMGEYERLFNIKILNRCKKKDMECTLTLEQFIDLVTQNCFYCDEEPKMVGYDNNKCAKTELKKCAGVDRIDSSIGYVLENCRPCCKTCNTAKASLSESEFREWIDRIHLFYILGKEVLFQSGFNSIV